MGKEENDIDFVAVLDNFVQIEVPQQKNGFDCGMFVVELSQFVAAFLIANKSKDQQKQCLTIPDVDFAADKKIKFDGKYMIEARKKWQQIINEMAKEQKQQKKMKNEDK